MPSSALSDAAGKRRSSRHGTETGINTNETLTDSCKLPHRHAKLSGSVWLESVTSAVRGLCFHLRRASWKLAFWAAPCDENSP